MSASRPGTEPIPRSRKIMLMALVTVLWLATAAIGFLAFIALQDIAATATGYIIAVNPDVGTVEARGWITTARNTAAIVGGLLWLAVVVGGMEYHFRRIGHRRSWRIFAWTLGIEVALVIISVLFF